MATTENADRILAGEYAFEGKMEKYVEKYLKEMKKDPRTEDIRGGFTREEFQSTWKRTKERTSSSAKDNFLSQVMADAISLPYLIGRPPERYKRMVACFLRKKIKNTRTIWLLDAMFSCGGKILARRTMEAAKEVGALADENFGGVKGKSAEQQAVNTRLMIDLAIQLRKNTSIAPYDLTSCYDRFAHPMHMGNRRKRTTTTYT